MNREAWQAIVHGVAEESDMTEHARMHKLKHIFDI